MLVVVILDNIQVHAIIVRNALVRPIKISVDGISKPYGLRIGCNGARRVIANMIFVWENVEEAV